MRKRRKSAKRGGPGRPTAYAAKLGQAIAERLAGGEPLVSICTDASMPDRVTVWRWQLQHPEFCNMIIAAREWGADALGEEVLTIADHVAGDVGRDKLRCTARMWLVSKIAPRRYGERISQEISGPDGGPVPVAMLSMQMPPIEVSRAVAALLKKAEAQAGLASSKGRLTAKARMANILGSGKPMPPAVYAALIAARKVTDG